MNKKNKKAATATDIKKQKLKPEIKQVAPEIKKQTIELFTQQSDELAAQEAIKRRERQKQKITFLDGASIIIEDLLADAIVKHITKFHKPWFYRLADLYNVDRKVMDVYVKPEFVRQFIIQFVYGRFPYLLLRTLRSRNRKANRKNCKLFQHLNGNASKKLDDVIKEVFDVMGESSNPLDFKMRYSRQYKLFFQVELF